MPLNRKMIIFLGTALVATALVASAALAALSSPLIAPPPPAPPPGFNPLTASAAQLAGYGFPTRPTNVSALKQWDEAMSHAKYYVAPVQVVGSAVHGLVNTENNTIWAGYSDTTGYNGVDYNEVTAEWLQPSYSGGGTADPSFWTGLGPANGSDLAQAGADSNASEYGGANQYEFWIQNFPQQTIWEAAPVVRPGDELYVTLDENSSQTNASVFLENVTTNSYTIVDLNTPDNANIETAADYINEAPHAVYSNWGSTTFYDCYLYSGSQQGYFDSYNYTKIRMVSSSGTLEAAPSSPSGGAFSVTSQ